MSALLLIGYGNPGRGDDGLGPALVDRLRAAPEPGVDLISDYQLSVDLAHDIAPYETVIFADAAITGPAPFSFQALEPAPPLSFTSHSQRPEGVLFVARALYGAGPRAFQLGIRGYCFDRFVEALSSAAARNLDASLCFLHEKRARLVDVRAAHSEGLHPDAETAIAHGSGIGGD